MLRFDGRPGLGFLIVFLSIYLSVLWGRGILHRQGPPAFSVAGPSGTWVELGDGFACRGVEQIFDASTLADVINLTSSENSRQNVKNFLSYRTLVSGERLQVGSEIQQDKGSRRLWMNAGKRIALGIPLHPDRMTVVDWQCLPGIGPVLALRVEKNRQKYGDFGSIMNLSRVNGIGPKRLASIKDFF